jgi:hypothetical protein
MNLLAYILLSTAGIGFLSMIMLAWINDWLFKRGWSVIELELAFVALLPNRDRMVAEREGLVTLLFAGWFLTLGFVLLWLMPWFNQAFPTVFLATIVYVAMAWLVVMLVLLPLLNKGFFGSKHHELLPCSAAILLFCYAALLAFFTHFAL